MSPKTYAQAIIELLKESAHPKRVLAGLDATLMRRGHGMLKRQILTIVYRTLEARKSSDGVRLAVVKEGDEKRHAKAIAAICEALNLENPTEVRVDDTLIGGFVLSTENTRIDRSHKRTLYNLYRSIINSSHP